MSITPVTGRSPVCLPVRLPEKRARTAGFTLIEVMVVVLIIGITVSFAVLTIGGGGEDPAETEARRLAAHLDVVREEAILQGRSFGLHFEPDGYQFFILGGEEWLPVDGDQLLRQRSLPDSLRLELVTEGEQVDFFPSRDEDEDEDEKDAENEDLPQVFFLSSGEVSPFSLSVRPFEGSPYRIDVDEVGALELTQEKRF